MKPSTCSCGKELKYILADVIHNMFHKNITIKNAPHLNCEACENKEYLDKDNKQISFLLREAYLSNQNEIEFR